jgi:hypothetical protein
MIINSFVYNPHLETNWSKNNHSISISNLKVANIYKLQKHVLLRHQSYLIVFMGTKLYDFGR